MSADKSSSGSLHRLWFRARIAAAQSSKRQGRYITAFTIIFVVVGFAMPFLALMRARYDQPFELPVEQSCQDQQSDPSKRPRPLLILIAGESRSGTTYLYNLLRILLRQRDPNTISGWYEDMVFATRYASPPIHHKAQTGILDAFNSTGTTVLVKVHSLGHATSLFSGCQNDFYNENCLVDSIFLTHRDLAPQVNSQRRMGWSRQTTSREVASKSVCFLKTDRRRLLKERDWELPRTWRIQAKAIAVCHEAWKTMAGHKLAMDVGMETLIGNRDERIQLAKDLIQKLDSSTLNRMDAEAAVTEADALRPLDCASHLAVNPGTHFHRGHVASSGDEGKTVQLGYEAIAADSDLAVWRKNHGYVQ